MKILNPATETTITEVEADTPDTVAAKVAAADERDIAMVFTGIRHFRH